MNITLTEQELKNRLIEVVDNFTENLQYYLKLECETITKAQLEEINVAIKSAEWQTKFEINYK